MVLSSDTDSPLLYYPIYFLKRLELELNFLYFILEKTLNWSEAIYYLFTTTLTNRKHPGNFKSVREFTSSYTHVYNIYAEMEHVGYKFYISF